MRTITRSNTPRAWRYFGAAILALMASSAASPLRAQVVDDFSDLNDTANPTWTHLSGLVGSTGQTWNASTGQYQLQAPNNGLAVGSNGQLGFVGSYTGPSFSNVRVAADFVQPATGAAYGLAARLDGNNALNALKGYAYAYEPFTNAGEMVLYRITGASLSDIGSQPVTLDLANKDYRFVLEIIGNQLHGQVFEIGGGMVAERFATDSTYASGFSGVFGYSAVNAGVTTNFTIDNFRAGVPEPATGLLLAAGLGAICVARRQRSKR